MTSTNFSVYPNSHHLHANEDGFDLDFIEAAHYDRERSLQMDAHAQRALDGTPNIEHYAPKDVTVLALPVLYCMAHASEHACAHQHTLVQDMGVCDLTLVTDSHKYAPAQRVTITAAQTYTGRIERA